MKETGPTLDTRGRKERVVEVMEQLVDVKAVMAACGVSRATVDRWVASGALRPVQLPMGNGEETGHFGRLRFRRADIEALIQGATA
jgi:predicted DNA-binding transcriptional regulator AlpA